MNEMMGPIIMASQEFTTAESSDFGAQQKIIVIQLQKKQKLEGVSACCCHRLSHRMIAPNEPQSSSVKSPGRKVNMTAVL